MYQEREQPGTENVNGDIRPTGVFVGLGTKVSGTQLDFRQGGMEPTGRTLISRFKAAASSRSKLKTVWA